MAMRTEFDALIERVIDQQLQGQQREETARDCLRMIPSIYARFVEMEARIAELEASNAMFRRAFEAVGPAEKLRAMLKGTDAKEFVERFNQL